MFLLHLALILDYICLCLALRSFSKVRYINFTESKIIVKLIIINNYQRIFILYYIKKLPSTVKLEVFHSQYQNL